MAEPTIAEAYANCVTQGANLIVVHPYFLLPGRHWNEDIPRLAAEASKAHPNTSYLVTAPLGLHPLMHEVIHSRVAGCLAHAIGQQDGCHLCDTTPEKCVIHRAASTSVATERRSKDS